MTQMNIKQSVKEQYHIESGKYWTPSEMGSTIYAFKMVDFNALEEFKAFLGELGFKVREIYKQTVYAR